MTLVVVVFLLRYLSAIGSHGGYFGSMDVALFLARALRDLDVSNPSPTA